MIVADSRGRLSLRCKHPYEKEPIGAVFFSRLHGLTSEQAEYNQYAPILMTSVDTDPTLCARERNAIIERLGIGKWQIFGAHGAKKDYAVNS